MIPLPNLPKVIQKKENKAVFEISPLYPGYGVTIGNSYRRVLLSSLEGAAITEVRIKNAPHEFTALPGVLEDILIILLNLKKVRIQSWENTPQTIVLEAKGAREVKAKDFKPHPQVKIVNPELHLATLTDKKAELSLEATVERGVGYVLAEEREKGKQGIGVIYLDSVFTPVKKVNFYIENVIVGKRTDFEKLEIEIETDGTISPEEAFGQATEILYNHFSLFSQFGKKIEIEAEKAGQGEEVGKEEITAGEETAKIKVEDLKLSERTKNSLRQGKIKTVGGIVKKSEKEILALKGMGEKGLKEIKKALEEKGLSLKEENKSNKK